MKEIFKKAADIKKGDFVDTSVYPVDSVHIVGNTVIQVIKGLGTFTNHVSEIVKVFVKEKDEKEEK